MPEYSRDTAVLALASAGALLYDVPIGRALEIADSLLLSGDVARTWRTYLDQFAQEKIHRELRESE